MKKVNSSNIDSIHYSPDTKVLEIYFKQGKVYHYSDVSQQTYNRFENSKSLGKFLHSHINAKHSKVIK